MNIANTPDKRFNAYRIPNNDRMKAVITRTQDLLGSQEKRIRRRKAQDQKTWEDCISAVVCDLAYCHLTRPHGWVSVLISNNDSLMPRRYKSHIERNSFPKVLGSMQEAGVIKVMKGFRGEKGSKGRLTITQAADWLKGLLEGCGITLCDFSQHYTGETIWLRRYGKVSKYEDTSNTMRWRAELQSINHWLRKLDITYLPDGTEANHIDTTKRHLRRIFCRYPRWLGGRLYGGFWQEDVSKRQRNQGLRINGEMTISLDFDQMALNLLYGHHPFGADMPEGDGYDLPGMDPKYRKGIKQTVNAMISARHKLTDWPKDMEPMIIRDFSFQDVEKLILRKHSNISHLFYQDMGVQTQYEDSRIMVDILKTLITNGLSGLPVHDAIIAPVSMASQVEEIMRKSFRRLTGRDCNVSRE